MKKLTHLPFLALTALTAVQPIHARADHRHTRGTRCETATHFRASVSEAGNVLRQIFAMVKGSGVMAPEFKSETAEAYRIGEVTLLRTIRIYPDHSDETFTLELDNYHDSVAQMRSDDKYLNLAAPQAAKILYWLHESIPYRPEYPEIVPPKMPWVLNEVYPKPSQSDLFCPGRLNTVNCSIKLGYLKSEHSGCYP